MEVWGLHLESWVRPAHALSTGFLGLEESVTQMGNGFGSRFPICLFHHWHRYFVPCLTVILSLVLSPAPLMVGVAVFPELEPEDQSGITEGQLLSS